MATKTDIEALKAKIADQAEIISNQQMKIKELDSQNQVLRCDCCGKVDHSANMSWITDGEGNKYCVCSHSCKLGMWRRF